MKTRSNRRILSVLLAIAIALSVSATALATENDIHYEEDIWTVNISGTTATVTRLANAYTSSLTGITVDGTAYIVDNNAATTISDAYGSVQQATFTLNAAATSESKISVQYGGPSVEIVVDGVSKGTYTLDDLSGCVTKGSYSYTGKKTGDGDAYTGITTEYITVPALLNFLGVSEIESISFRPIDWKDSTYYIRTLTADEAEDAVLSIKGYQSSKAADVTAEKADTLNALRLIPSREIAVGFDSVKWVNYISVTTADSTGANTGTGTSGSTVDGGAVKEITSEVSTEVTDGSATVTVDGDALTKAAEEANKDTQFVISGDLDGETVTEVITITPMPAVKAVAGSGASIQVETALGGVALANKTLTGVAGYDGEDLIVTMKNTGDGTTEITVAVDGTDLDTVSGGITATVPAQSGNVAALVNDDGSETVIPKSVVENNTAYVLLPGSAKVKIIDNSKNFTDVEDTAWYKDAVDFASSHELFNGVSGTEFAPTETMNRAMLVTVLHRLEDTPAVTETDLFDDVDDGTWYTDAVAWADTNGIVNGYGNGSFGPTDSVTREQIAAILYRYMQYLGMDVSARDDLSRFGDGAKTSDWANEAMQWAVGAGIINGKSDTVLDPGGDATRAEVATMLQRIISLMIR